MIKTIADIDPSKIYITKEQYKTIKHAKPKKTFNVKNKDIANQLIMLNIIEKEQYLISVDKENMTDEEYQEYRIYPDYEETGKYLLTIIGEYVLEYRKLQRKSRFWIEFRAWMTLAISRV